MSWPAEGMSSYSLVLTTDLMFPFRMLISSKVFLTIQTATIVTLLLAPQILLRSKASFPVRSVNRLTTTHISEGLGNALI